MRGEVARGRYTWVASLSSSGPASNVARTPRAAAGAVDRAERAAQECVSGGSRGLERARNDGRAG